MFGQWPPSTGFCALVPLVQLFQQGTAAQTCGRNNLCMVSRSTPANGKFYLYYWGLRSKWSTGKKVENNFYSKYILFELIWCHVNHCTLITTRQKCFKLLCYRYLLFFSLSSSSLSSSSLSPHHNSGAIFLDVPKAVTELNYVPSNAMVTQLRCISLWADQKWK